METMRHRETVLDEDLDRTFRHISFVCFEYKKALVLMGFSEPEAFAMTKDFHQQFLKDLSAKAVEMDLN